MNLSTSLDPMDKLRDVGEENGLNLMAVPTGRREISQHQLFLQSLIDEQTRLEMY